MTSRRVAVVLIGACWIVAVGASLEVARRTAIGPVIVRLSETHGVHLGDVIVVASAAVVAGVTTRLLWPDA